MAEEMFESKNQNFLGEMYTGDSRCRVESEAILPEYKEAAQRILRVDVKPRLNSKNVYLQGQTAVCEVEGVATFRILYFSDEEKKETSPRFFFTQENFSFTFKIPLSENCDAEKMAVVPEMYAENVSYKLMGPRKIGMRCDVRGTVNMKCNRTLSYFTKELSDDIVTKTKKINGTVLTEVYQEELTFSETICLPGAYPEIGEVGEMDVDLFSAKVMTLDGAITFSGNCDVQCSYAAKEEGNLVSFYQPIEFERKLNIPSCTKDHVAVVHLLPNFLKAVADINEEGENRNILFEIGCTAEIHLYEKKEVEVVEDAFSTETYLECDTAKEERDELYSQGDFSVPVRSSFVRNEEKILRAEGIRGKAEFKTSYVENGKIAVEGRMTVRFLGVRENGECFHGEQSEEFKVFIPFENAFLDTDGVDCRIEIYGGVRGVDLDPVGDRLELRYDLCGQFMIFCRHRFHLIRSMTRGEARGKAPCGILFYYPEKEEDLWSVCKRYHVDPNLLCEENEIENEILPPVIHITR